MSSPFTTPPLTTPWRSTLASPLRLLLVVMVAMMTVGIAATSLAAELAEGRSDAVVTTDLGAATIHVDRSPAVSRAGDRTAGTRAERAPKARRVVDATRVERRPVRPALPLAPSNAAQTAASAMESTTNEPGQCLGWAREQAGIPSKYAAATTAWRHASGRHTGNATPPRGAAVYWTGGSSGHGHVAISLGNGLVRSSDAGGSGTVATVPIRYFDREWDLEYAGWAGSINGYAIPGVAIA
ncbi:CHAP domain-containing protein [Nocardioides sp. LMS-CY]|uniref:CHAP domain-containing protein n=1 Tax=Nocardioides sp. (strain LMS-CY) TaxID=2840457 RepID=UPI001BFFDE3C|nr:CHAP domain-containing protein [Nocardioides sp. LMS-CY]QWF23369.1 CHAP domain-containing protein [Nocardioides sp. LMS-CY]